jgi:hypothetical protein
MFEYCVNMVPPQPDDSDLENVSDSDHCPLVQCALAETKSRQTVSWFALWFEISHLPPQARIL